MIELYISSNTDLFTCDIAWALAQNDVECQVYNNSSAYKCCGQMYVENGFYIYIHNVDAKDFVNKVWNVLEQTLALKCAGVNTSEYKGCVLNWPNVFKEEKDQS